MTETEAFLSIDLRSFLLALVVLMVFIVFFITLSKKIMDIFGIEIKGFREKKEDHDLLIKTSQRVEEVSSESNDKYNELSNDMKNLTASVKSIMTKLDDMQTKNDESERAKLKDRIAQAYRKYHEVGEWTDMEKEAFQGLIKDYENHGGKNSFVHSICEPESLTWRMKK